MNTTKQINIMVALVFLAVIATGAYTLWDPHRASDAKEVQLDHTIERGAFLFAQNCAVCHGDAGEGGAAANRLRQAPPLDRDDLQGVDPETSAVTKQLKDQAFKLVFNTISCGRVGKAMPTWGQVNGGTLNDEQIRQLATLITEGTGWDKTEEFAIEGDPENLHEGYGSEPLRLERALSESDTVVYLDDASSLGPGSRLQIDEELMSVTEAPNAEDNSVVVERGLGTTSPEAHEAGVDVLKPPVPPDPPPVTQPACGQNLPAEVPSAVPEAPTPELNIVAQGTAWSKPTLSAVAGVPLTLTLDNKDNGIAHNIHFTVGAEPGGETVARTDIQPGPAVETLNFGPLDAGDYYYICDVHPGQMEGVMTAYPPGEGPAGAATPAAADAAPAE